MLKMSRHGLPHLRQSLCSVRCFLSHHKFQPLDEWRKMRYLTTVPKPQSDNEEFCNAKPYSAIPGPFALPFLGCVHKTPEYLMTETWHEGISKSFQDYGPIYRESVGGMKFVFTNDVDGVEKLHRQEGKYPRRVIMYPWRYWRDEHGLSRGILTECVKF